MDDSYYTIDKPSVEEIKVKDSRFIAHSKIVASIDEAMEQLNRIRKKEYNATHNCYAYTIGKHKEQRTYKYSDDGEPSGTAGKPIYDTICGREITSILLVVTRYFGGTKLGTGGLVRAYSQAASLVLDKSGRKENYINDKLKIEIEFSLYDRLKKTIHHFGAIQARTDYSDRVSMDLYIRKSKTELLMTEIAELSGGKAKIEKT